jgi:hypothetical protein
MALRAVNRVGTRSDCLVSRICRAGLPYFRYRIPDQPRLSVDWR